MAEWIFNEYERSSYLTADTNEIITNLEKKERIVRCKDCKYIDKQGRWTDYVAGKPQELGCRHFMDYEGVPLPVELDGFCAWGEEREE